MRTITRELTEETYTKAKAMPRGDAEEILFTVSDIWGYGVYGWTLYTTEEADGTHYWLRYDRGNSCD